MATKTFTEIPDYGMPANEHNNGNRAVHNIVLQSLREDLEWSVTAEMLTALAEIPDYSAANSTIVLQNVQSVLS